jgi:hypothetical protein
MGMVPRLDRAGAGGDSIAAMGGLLGLPPMSVAVANSCWLTAIALTIVPFVMSLRQGMRTRL